jgi:hypothetical protein
MAYIGKIPATQGKDAGPSLKLDDVSSNFDGLTTVFDLTVNGTEVDPHINNIQIYLSGVHQLPGTSYSLSGSQVVFSGAPSSSLNFHGSIIGDARLFIPDNDTVETSAFTTNTISAISGAFGNQRVGTTDDVQFNHITASGNISASGIVIADTFQSTGGSVDGISFTDDLNITGNITASGAISSSVGNFTTVNIDGGTVDGITSLTAGGDLDIGTHDFRAATITADGLTATRVPFAGTDGVLSDDSDLTFATDTLTATKIGAFTAAGAIDFDSQNMTNVDIDSGTITGITDLTVADGGTGVSTLTDGGVLLGSGTSAITAMAVLADSEMIVGDGSTDPVAESGATLRTSIGVGTTDDVQFTNITGSEVSSSTALFTTATIDNIGAFKSVGAIDFDNQNMTNVDIDSGVITGITDLTVADGGTGVSTLTGGVLLGSGAGAITAMSVLSDGELIVGDGSTDPVAESGATLRTSIGVGLTDDVVFSNVSGAAATFNSATINGLLTVEEIHTVFVSASVTVATGSNIFGDAIVDIHQFTGSIDQSGSLSTVDITSDNLFSSNITGSIISGSTALLTTATIDNIGAFKATGAIDFDNQNMTNVDIDSGVITGITDLTVADGGTGVSTLTDGGVLLGNGTGVIQAMAVLTDGQMIVGDGTTDPVAESGATLRTSIGVGLTDDVVFSAVSGSTATFSDYVGNVSGSSTSTGSFGSVIGVGNSNSFGNTDIDGTLTVGVDDAGYDVIFFGNSASSNVTWDTSEDDLILNDSRLKIIQDDAERSLEIVQTGNGDAVLIQQIGSGDAIKINFDGTSGNAIEIASPTSTTGTCLLMQNANALTTGGVAEFHSNSADTGTRNVVFIANDHASAVNATALKIQQDAAAIALHIETTTKSGLYVHNNVDASAEPLVKIHAQGDDFDQNVLQVVNAGDAHGIEISGNGSLHISTASAPAKIRLTRAEADEALVDNDVVGEIEFFSNDGSVASNAQTKVGRIVTEIQSTALQTNMQFHTFNTDLAERMRIIADGKVGIGVSAPTALLHVTGGTINNTVGDQAATFLKGFSEWGFQELGTTGDNGLCIYGVQGGTPRLKYVIGRGHTGSNDFHKFYTAETERLRIDAGGDTHTNDGSVSSLSDKRSKKNIADLEDGLSIINQLKPKTFQYNGKTSIGIDDGKTRYGFIADDVLEVASHYVEIHEEELDGVVVDDFKSLSVTRMIPMMIKSIQQLSEKNEALEKRIKELEN